MGFLKSRPKTLPRIIDSPTKFPSWSVVKTETGVYLIKGKTKFRIASQRALDSWSFNVIQATDEAIANYKLVGKLGFRNNTLIRNFSDYKLYLIVDNKRCQIISPDYLENIGLDTAPIYMVSQEELILHEEGEVLS